MKSLGTVAKTFALLSVLALSPVAQAVSISYYLDQSNIESSYPDNTNYLKVTISDGNNGDIDFKVEALSSLGSGATIDSFGFNPSSSITLTSTNISGPSGWTLGTNNNQDGFGKYIDILNTTGQNTVNPLMFSITGISGDTPMDYVNFSTGNAGQGNVYFAAHVKGLTNISSGSGYFGGSVAVVPETSSWAMMLVGVGLVGLRLRKRQEGVRAIQA